MTPERFGDQPPGDEDISREAPGGADLSGQGLGQDRIRRLLAAAGADRTPMPEEVAQRLDAVLADLVAARETSAAEEAPVTSRSLSERRTRRWPRVLVAAAAVAVVGLGVSNVVERTGGSGAMGQADDAGAGGGSAARKVQPERAPSASDEAPEGVPGGPDRLSADPARDLPRLRTRSLTAEAQRIADSTTVRGGLSSLGRRHPATCGGLPPAVATKVRVGRILAVAVRLDGQPATMVFDPVVAGQRRVRVYQCPPVPTRSDADSPPTTRLLATTQIDP